MRGLQGLELVKPEIKTCCSVKDEKETAALQGFVTAVTTSSDTFKKWLEDAFEKLLREKKITLVDIDNLCNALSLYIDYFKGDDVKRFQKLFYYMLAVDAAIETDRIGMINF